MNRTPPIIKMSEFSKRLLTVAWVIGLLLLSGCAGPLYYQRESINSFYKQENLNANFRGTFVESKDVVNLKSKAKDYISRNPAVDEKIKSALANLKVIPGMNQEQVKLLLGEPDKAQDLGCGNRYKANERWVYKKADLKCVYFVPLPLFFTNDSFRLYFKDGIVAGIEEVKIKAS